MTEPENCDNNNNNNFFSGADCKRLSSSAVVDLRLLETACSGG